MLPLLALLAAVALPPKPTHYVTDRAGILDARREGTLNAKLAQFERDTSNQILVYTDERLPPDTSIEDMGAEAMRQWGVGRKGKDNGAIFFVFTGERKMRIEVGYGFEATLTDAKSKHITSTIIKPEFQKGDFAAGVEKGVDAMMAAAREQGYVGTGRTVAEIAEQPSPPAWPPWLIGSVMVAMLVGCFTNLIFGGILGARVHDDESEKRSRRARGFRQRFIAWLPTVAAMLLLLIGCFFSITQALSYAFAALLLLGVPFLMGFVFAAVVFHPALAGGGSDDFGSSSTSSSSSGTSFSSSGTSFSSSSSSSSSSGSSSSDSFSGGGGSGGGGGASDSW